MQEPRNLEHRRANFKGKTAFSAQEVSLAFPSFSLFTTYNHSTLWRNAHLGLSPVNCLLYTTTLADTINS